MVFTLRKMAFWVTGVICIMMFAVGPSLVGAEKPVYTLRFGGSDPIDGLEDRSNKIFIDLVEKRSDGRIKIEYFPFDQLGKEKEQIEGVRVGTQDFFSDPLVWYGPMVTNFKILSWGYGFRDTEHVDKFLKSPVFQEEMAEKLRKEYGVRILAAVHRTPRVLFARKPIFGLEDIQGMKMRCPPIEMFVVLWTALGTKPTQISWAEAYLALQQGVADGIEASVAVNYYARHYEPCPYLMLTNHMMDTQHIMMRDATYQKLPTDLQRIIVEAAQESMDWYGRMADESEDEIINKMIKEGVVVIRFDIEPWQKKVGEKVEEMEAKGYWEKGLYERIQQIR